MHLVKDEDEVHFTAKGHITAQHVGCRRQMCVRQTVSLQVQLVTMTSASAQVCVLLFVLQKAIFTMAQRRHHEELGTTIIVVSVLASRQCAIAQPAAPSA